MNLGAFSVSLAVKDLVTSRNFYEKLGFEVLAGSLDANYLMMSNESTVIGLFQDMFEGNILTFNPGWNCCGENVDPFTDIRELESSLKNKELPFVTETDKNTSEGPASFMLTDPDGNIILIDQHR